MPQRLLTAKLPAATANCGLRKMALPPRRHAVCQFLRHHFEPRSTSHIKPLAFACALPKDRHRLEIHRMTTRRSNRSTTVHSARIRCGLQRLRGSRLARPLQFCVRAQAETAPLRQMVCSALYGGALTTWRILELSICWDSNTRAARANRPRPACWRQCPWRMRTGGRRLRTIRNWAAGQYSGDRGQACPTPNLQHRMDDVSATAETQAPRGRPASYGHEAKPAVRSARRPHSVSYTRRKIPYY